MEACPLLEHDSERQPPTPVREGMSWSERRRGCAWRVESGAETRLCASVGVPLPHHKLVLVDSDTIAVACLLSGFRTLVSLIATLKRDDHCPSVLCIAFSRFL